MKAKYGSLIVSGSGSLGGHVYSASRKGFTTRNAPIGCIQASSLQLKQRAIFKVIGRQWGKLLAADRTKWLHFTFAGVSGFEAFRSCNLYRLRYGLQLASSPPLIENHAYPSLVSLTCQVSSQSVIIRYNASRTPNYAYFVYLTRCMSPGRLAKESDYRLLSTAVGNNTALLDMSSAWFNKFGSTLHAGLAVNLKVQLMRNGLIYNTSYLSSIVI